MVRGKRPGLYTSWEECSAQVTGFPGNKYKSFTYAEDAAEYMAANGMAEAAAHSVPALPTAPAARRAVQLSTRAPRRVKPLVPQVRARLSPRAALLALGRRQLPAAKEGVSTCFYTTAC